MKIFNVKKKKIIKAFRDGKIKVAVYGLGKIGLPLAAVFAEKGANVIGVDTDKKVVEFINQGKNHIKEEPSLDKLVKKNVKSGKLSATTNLVKASQDSDIMIIIVPTILDKNNFPDLNPVRSVCTNIAKGLEKGNFVVLESTVPPGTTKNVVKPILEKTQLKAGRDFGLAHCPERVSSGHAIRDITRSYPKIVGGINEESSKTAEALYSRITSNRIITTDSTTAEIAKLFQGLYRDVNIALANELAMYCRQKGIDFFEAKKIGNTDPFCKIHNAGAGVGGHCIPIYPYFIIKTANTNTSLIELARKINDSMPRHMVDLVKEGLNSAGRTIKDSNILILGLAYRGGVKEARNSPAIPITKILQNSGADIFLYDPLFSREEIEDYGVKYTNDFKDMDCIVLVTGHKEFYDLDWEWIKSEIRTRVVVDGRQVVDPKKMKGLGFVYRGIGRVHD